MAQMSFVHFAKCLILPNKCDEGWLTTVTIGDNNGHAKCRSTQLDVCADP